MKKSIMLLFVLILSISMLTGCGEQDDGMKTVKITSEDFGDISFGYIEKDESIAVTVAEEGSNLDVLKEYNDKILPSNTMDYQKAHIKGEDFNILIGYIDWSKSNMKTYSAMKFFRRLSKAGEIELGDLGGFSHASDVFLLTFPATTQYGARIIALYPHEKPEKSLSGVKDWEYMLEIPKVKEILDTIKFSGEKKDEPKYETEPITMNNYTVTPTDGWEIYSDWVTSVKLKKEGVADLAGSKGGAGEISINTSRVTPQEQLDKRLSSTTSKGQKQIDNIQIGDREFLVIKDEKPINDTYILITSTGPEFNPEADSHIEITISYLNDLAPAMNLLENITIKK